MIALRGILVMEPPALPVLTPAKPASTLPPIACLVLTAIFMIVIAFLPALMATMKIISTWSARLAQLPAQSVTLPLKIVLNAHPDIIGLIIHVQVHALKVITRTAMGMGLGFVHLARVFARIARIKHTAFHVNQTF